MPNWNPSHKDWIKISVDASNILHKMSTTVERHYRQYDKILLEKANKMGDVLY